MGRPTPFLFSYTIFEWTTLWLDSLQFALYVLHGSLTPFSPKIVGYKPQPHYAGPPLLNRTRTQSSWLIPSHSIGALIFARSSSSNVCVVLTSTTYSSADSCVNCVWSSNASPKAPSCLSAQMSCNWISFPSIVVVSVNASSSQG